MGRVCASLLTISVLFGACKSEPAAGDPDLRVPGDVGDLAAVTDALAPPADLAVVDDLHVTDDLAVALDMTISPDLVVVDDLQGPDLTTGDLLSPGCVYAHCPEGTACSAGTNACTPKPMEELGEDLCPNGGWPTNFVRRSHGFTGSYWPCSVADVPALRLSDLPSFVAHPSASVYLRTGDPIAISFRGWAGGATTQPITVTVSPDNVTFSACGATDSVEWIGGHDATLTCASPFDANALYVKLEVFDAGGSSVIFLQNFTIDLSATCLAVDTGYACNP